MRFKDRLEYGVDILWDGSTGGLVSCDGRGFRVDTPAEWGGGSRGPCPDELFLASLGGRLLTTFLHFARRLGVTPGDVRISTSMEIALGGVEGYRIQGVRAEIWVEAEEEVLERVRRCVELAVNYCHITRSLEEAIPLEVDVRVEARGQ